MAAGGTVTEIGDKRRGAGDDVIEEDGEAGAAGESSSIEDRAAAGEHEEDDGTNQLVLPGTGSKLSTNVGGKKPTESYFKMRGVALPIQGGFQIEKDTEMWVAVRVAIDDVTVTNRRKDDQIVSTKKTHVAVPLGQPIILDGPPEGYEG